MTTGRILAEFGLWALRGARSADLMDFAADQLARALEVEVSAIFHLTPDGFFILRSGVGWPDALLGTSIQDETLAEYTLAHGAQVLVTDARDESHFRLPALFRTKGITCGFSVPITGTDMPIGVLCAFSVRHRTFSAGELALASALANILALAIVRNRAESQVHRRNQEFLALVETSPDVIVRLDTEFRYLYANASAERLHLLPSSAMQGRTDRDLGMPESLASRWELMLRAVTSTGRERTFEPDVALPTQVGERWFRSRIVPEFDDTGAVESLLVTWRDITELRRAAAERGRLNAELVERQRREEQLFEQLVSAQGDENRRLKRAALLTSLTTREREILGLVAQGYTNRQIASMLNLSPGTVKNHVSRLLPKLGAVDRTHAAAEASELGLTSSFR